MKRALFVVVAALTLCSCAQFSSWYHKTFSASTQAQVGAAGQQLAADALKIAAQSVDAIATGQSDAQIKNNFVQSSGDALRSLEGTGISVASAAVQDVVSSQLEKWLPNLPHWSGFSDKIGALLQQFAAQRPNDPKWLSIGLEIVAQALNTKPPTQVTSP